MEKIWGTNSALLDAIVTVGFVEYFVFKVAKKLSNAVVSHYQHKDL